MGCADKNKRLWTFLYLLCSLARDSLNEFGTRIQPKIPFDARAPGLVIGRI